MIDRRFRIGYFLTCLSRKKRMNTVRSALLLILLTIISPFALTPPDITFRVFGDGDPVSGAMVLSKLSTPGCGSNNGRIIFAEIGTTDHNGNVMLSDTSLKKQLWQQCGACACWEAARTEVRYRVMAPGFIRADNTIIFEAAKEGGRYDYAENYYIDILLDKDTATVNRPSDKKWGRFEIRTPKVPGASYYMENGVWIAKKSGSKKEGAPVSLTLRTTVLSEADKSPLDYVRHRYQWGHDAECGDSCVTRGGGEYRVILGKSPISYNSANYPKTCHIHLKRIGFHDFDADIPITNIAAPEEILDVYMTPLN